MTTAEQSWPPRTRQVRLYRNIVVDGACNIRCTYCEVKKAKVDQAATIASLDRIFAEYEPDSVLFRVESDGEITLYRKIVDHLQRRAAEGYRIEVLSNGTKLPTALAGRPDLLWVFSVDGHTAEMNAKRGLSQQQVDRIIDAAVDLGAELQSVYWGQPIEQVNAYIDLLAERGYRGLLHFMPLLAFKGRPLEVDLRYQDLHPAEFLAPPEYFRRWNHIFETGTRDAVCDQITNGYNYQVTGEQIRMVKCDCYSVPKHLFHAFGAPREYDNWPCGTCIANQEFNNSRSRMQIPQGRIPLPLV
ncbi:radical SAM protein [Kitasatospora sp. NPDC089913]|uniref:radical SAM protein n=1 Tax=Streptomycetaceae TaxID=2062 RepID=UPI00087B5B46|nr:radical SAM protein [Streptomyces sp. TLI_053]SDT82440.1 Radical SAM superfamily protein [Streptomyces sp. TLI_053]